MFQSASLALVFLSTTLGRPAPTEGPAGPASGLDVEVRFTDGSTVRMTLPQSDLVIDTKYGRLTVPVADVRRIEFGTRVPADVGRRVEEAVKKLGSEVPAEREAATKELVALGAPAYPAVHAALQSTDLEVRRRAEDVITRLRARVPASQLRVQANDQVQTAEFPLVGRISSPALKARSPYFGEKELRISDLVSLRSLAGGSFEVTVDAGAAGRGGNAWVDSGVEVEADAALAVTATGEVDLSPDGTRQHVTGPGGFRGPAAAMAGFQAGARGPGGRGRGAYPGGALLGRIGEGGEAFVIGESFRGKAPNSGKLYLLIAPSPFDAVSAGSYKVKISVNESR